MAKAPNLSIAHAKKEDAKKYKKKNQVLFHDGTKLDVDAVFRPSKKEELGADLLKLIQGKIEKLENVDGNLLMAVLTSLIVKHFTSIEVKALETFDDHLKMYNILQDNDYLSPILQTFNPVDLQTMIEDTIKEANKQMKKISDELNRVFESQMESRSELNEETV
ncbi:hypothetical protein A616_17400 [Brevibacillus brevis X23]|nr:hypothetical protein A616_17400 [Brevibacillus brevis X23]